MDKQSRNIRTVRLWGVVAALGLAVVALLVFFVHPRTEVGERGPGPVTGSMKPASAATEAAAQEKAVTPAQLAEAKRVAAGIYREALLVLEAAPPPQGRTLYFYAQPTILTRLVALDPSAVSAVLPELKDPGTRALAAALGALEEGWNDRAKGLAQKAERHFETAEERQKIYRSVAAVLSSRQDFDGAEQAVENIPDPRERSFCLAALGEDANSVDPGKALHLYKKAFATAQEIPTSEKDGFVAFNKIAYGVMELDLELALAASRAGRKEHLPDKLIRIAERVAANDPERAIRLLEEAANAAAGNEQAIEEAKGSYPGSDIRLPDPRVQIARKMASLDKEKALQIALSIRDPQDRFNAFAALARETKDADRQFALKCLHAAMNDPAWAEPSLHKKGVVMSALAAVDPDRGVRLAREQGGVSALPVIAKELLDSDAKLAASLVEEFLADAATRNWWDVDSLQFQVALTVLAAKDLQRAVSLAKSRPRREMAQGCLLAIARDAAKERPELARAALGEAFEWAEKAESPTERYHLLEAVAGTAARAACHDLAARALEEELQILAAGSQPTNREPTETQEEYGSRTAVAPIGALASVDPWAAIKWAREIPDPRFRAHGMVVIADALLRSVGIEPANPL